jgi:hypothetical protein
VGLLVEGHGEAVTIEGAADVVDYEVLDRGGRPIAVRPAKTRQEPGTWGANELAKILLAWREARYAGADGRRNRFHRMPGAESAEAEMGTWYALARSYAEAK